MIFVYFGHFKLLLASSTHIDPYNANKLVPGVPGGSFLSKMIIFMLILPYMWYIPSQNHPKIC